MGSGGFELLVDGKDTPFYLGHPVTMNGVVVHCQDPAVPGSPFCSDWPASMVLGKTIVTATCWVDTTYVPGQKTIVCDEIDTGTKPFQKAR
jgi:hypothetical protein